MFEAISSLATEFAMTLFVLSQEGKISQLHVRYELAQTSVHRKSSKNKEKWSDKMLLSSSYRPLDNAENTHLKT